MAAPGGAWGADEIAKLNLAGVKYTPTGMAKLADKWHAGLPGYGIAGFDKNFGQSAVGYTVAAVVGVVVIVALTWIFAKYVAAKRDVPAEEGLIIKNV
jgi:cobalt/nickel transport protein